MLVIGETVGHQTIMAVDKSRDFIKLVRLGFAARGLTYMLLGFLAMSASSEAKRGQNGVFNYIQTIPLGEPLLFLVSAGLLGYALFKLLLGIANLEHNPRDAKGWARRVGDLGSAAVHIFLAFAAARFAIGADVTGGPERVAAPILDIMLGNFVIGLAGVGMMVAAAMQAREAWSGDFMRHISREAPTSVEWVGRAGHAARGVVFAVIGWSLIRAAWSDAGRAVKGLGEALMTLESLGMLYTLVAVGLLLFGAFSLVTARYRIIRDFDEEDLKPR